MSSLRPRRRIRNEMMRRRVKKAWKKGRGCREKDGEGRMRKGRRGTSRR
jgi:hypothetical protein